MRRIFGPVKDNNQWRFRYNELFDDLRIPNVIKLKRLLWTGHVERMDEERMPKRIQYGEIGGRRPIGKTK